MTTTELTAEADRRAALRADPRTPGVVRRAFLRPGALTLRKFLALEDAGSPVLDGRWPWEDAAGMAGAFALAWGVLFPGLCLPPAEALQGALQTMAGEVARGFDTVMPMRFPSAPGSPPAASPVDGLGWVARLLARAVAGLCLPPAAVLDMPLDALFVLTAALSANEGAECAGEDYRERDSAAAQGINPPSEPEARDGGAEENSQANEQSHISNVAQ